MAVQRVWFAHAPDGITGRADRARIGIGYGGIALAAPSVMAAPYITPIGIELFGIIPKTLEIQEL